MGIVNRIELALSNATTTKATKPNFRFLEDSFMHKRIQVPVRVLLISIAAVLTLLMASAVAMAGTVEDDENNERFDVVESTSTYAWFSLIDSGDCDDEDENCAVKVTKKTGSTIALGTDAGWSTLFDNLCKAASAANTVEADVSRESQDYDFEECWTIDHTGDTHYTDDSDTDPDFDVEWPIITFDDTFDITPYCQRNDDECAVELQLCYNPNDCDNNDPSDGASDSNEASSRVGDIWRDTEDSDDYTDSCLFDDDEDDVWDCVNDVFQDWLERKLSGSDVYDDFIDELDGDTNIGLASDDDKDYEDDLDDVGDGSGSSPRANDETTIQRYERTWRSARPTSIFEEEDEIDVGGYSFRPSQDEYLTIDFTSYLELTAPIQVCNTTIGCFNLVGSSSYFQQYMSNFYLQILDRKVNNCMEDLGYDVDDDHNVSFNNPDLIICDARIAEAVDLCPAENIGGDFITYEIYSLGLLSGILSESAANTMRTELESARVRTPQCLCAAGFEEKDMIISERESSDPWFSTTARRPADLC